jgi:hypothetical protein
MIHAMQATTHTGKRMNFPDAFVTNAFYFALHTIYFVVAVAR